MSRIVRIPEVKEDVRIGSVFNFLFQVIRDTEKAEGNIVVWDFQNGTFFHPFFIAPLTIYKQMNDKTIRCKNVSSACKSYFEKVSFENMMFIDKGYGFEKSIARI